jgi:hypothetical protein
MKIWDGRSELPRRYARGLLRGDLMLHHNFGLKTLEVAKDRSDSCHASVPFEAEKAVFVHDIAVDLDLIPGFRVTDIIDRDVIVLAPEERHLGERRALP